MVRLMLRVKIVFLLAALLLPWSVFAAQSTVDNPVTPDMKATARKDLLGGRADLIPAEPEYVIGHGDVLGIAIYGEGSMAITGSDAGDRSSDAGRINGAQVMIDGRVSLRHIGDVEVVGLTLTELADYLKKLYSVIYESPIVTATLLQSNSLRYTVLGQVLKPGVFLLDAPTTVVQVIARCGGFTEWADQEITIIRTVLQPGEEEFFTDHKLTLDFSDLLDGNTAVAEQQVRAGDVVIVE